MLSIFSCASWPSVCLLWKSVYLGLLPIFWLGCLLKQFIIYCIIIVVFVSHLHDFYFLSSSPFYSFYIFNYDFSYNITHPASIFKIIDGDFHFCPWFLCKLTMRKLGKIYETYAFLYWNVKTQMIGTPALRKMKMEKQGTNLPSHLEQIKFWTKCMKQHFLDIRH